MPEFTSDQRLVIGESSHTHYSAYTDIFEFTESGIIQQVGTLLFAEAEFGFFCSYMKLQQAINHPVISCGLFVDFPEQLEAVNRMNQ
ncbi:MAG: hypothetical protein RJA20_522 [Bacteroidota bacterium]